MLFISVILHFVALACASVIFQDCGSAYDLEDVEIDGCDLRQPCYITLDEHVPVNIYFVADFKSAKLEQDVVININQLDLETEVTPELCDDEICPVTTDCITSFTSVMRVPRRMALNQRGWLRWRVYNERKSLVLCYAVLIQTQSRSQKAPRPVGLNPEPSHNGTTLLTADHLAVLSRNGTRYIQPRINRIPKLTPT